MKRLFLSLIHQYLFWMVFFFILRAIFLLSNIKLIEADNIKLGEALLSFWYALKLDTATTGFILIVPAFLVFIQGLFKANWLNMVNKIFTFILIFCWTLITAVELASFPEWKYKLNTGAFLHMNNTKEAFYSISVLQFFSLLVFLIVVAGGSLYIYTRFFYLNLKERSRLIIYPFIYLIIIFPALFIMLRGGFNDIAISESSAFYSNHSVLNWTSVNSGYHFAVNVMETSRYKKSNNYQFYNIREARKTVEDILKTEKDSTVSILKIARPNIVILLMESWTADLIESLDGKSGITPEFAKLEKDGLLFTHFYCSGNRSHEGIASLLGGHPALPYTTFTANPVKYPRFPSMVQILDKAGYHSSRMNREFVPYPFEAKRHTAVLPALHDGIERRRHPVVVVGGGPVAYCTALGLANHGVPVVLKMALDRHFVHAMCAIGYIFRRNADRARMQPVNEPGCRPADGSWRRTPTPQDKGANAWAKPGKSNSGADRSGQARSR